MQRPPATAEAAERAFYAAMAAGDLNRMMALWADDDAVVCNHPGGPRLIGRDAVLASFREIFAGGGVRIDTAAVHAWRNADVAVHSLIERIAVEGRGGSELVEVVATNVFVRAGAGWRILVHHAAVAESSDATAQASDEDEDDEMPDWAGRPIRTDRPGEAGDELDEESSDADPRRPPPGRLH